METYFECKFEYDKLMENGVTKRAREVILARAVTCSEAENITIDEMRSYISGEFMVTDINRRKFAEVFRCDDDSADRFYKARLVFITLDERTGAEKKTEQSVLIEASDIEDARRRLNEGMKSSMMDWVLKSISETRYLIVA